MTDMSQYIISCLSGWLCPNVNVVNVKLCISSIYWVLLVQTTYVQWPCRISQSAVKGQYQGDWKERKLKLCFLDRFSSNQIDTLYEYGLDHKHYAVSNFSKYLEELITDALKSENCNVVIFLDVVYFKWHLGISIFKLQVQVIMVLATWSHFQDHSRMEK